MRNSLCLLALIALLPFAGAASAAHIWINEFHYDDDGTDSGEFIEVAVRTPNNSGFTAADYFVVRYNGDTASSGVTYDLAYSLSAFTASAPIPIMNSTDVITLYTYMYPVNGLQNGPRDGFALYTTSPASVVQFLSYEGTMTASNGPAATLVSVAVTGTESGSQVGTSLGAGGIGADATAFGPLSFSNSGTDGATPGAINVDQIFFVAPAPIPEPSSILMTLLAATAVGAVVMRKRLG